jgi:hypothetical protein
MFSELSNQFNLFFASFVITFIFFILLVWWHNKKIKDDGFQQDSTDQ